MLAWNSFLLAFSALLPLINPLGSALIFLGLVGDAPTSVYRSLARRVAINTAIFLVVIELLGATLLKFFGISLPIVQVAGGFVIASMGWSLLSETEPPDAAETAQSKMTVQAQVNTRKLEQRAFYPFTFPVTAGPGTLVVMLTLAAHASEPTLSSNVLSHLGIAMAAGLVSVMVYFFYAYAPRITTFISPVTAHGILRVVAFILMCIGVQIAWNGLAVLLVSVLKDGKV